MVRLVFPRHLSALIGHVQYALLQAKEQGSLFSISVWMWALRLSLF